MHAVERPPRQHETGDGDGAQLNHRVQLQNEQGDVRADKRARDQRVREHPQVLHRRNHDTCLRAVYLRVVPLDVAAEVLSNTHLSPDYNVLALAAPEIAERALPGQFVMVKAGDRLEPLLRRPFSVFEVLKAHGRSVGLSLLSKRIGPSTALLFDARPGDRVQCLGPLGTPVRRRSPRPTRRGSSPAASASRPSPRSPRRCASEASHVTLYYGARRAAELFYLDDIRAAWASSSC